MGRGLKGPLFIWVSPLQPGNPPINRMKQAGEGSGVRNNLIAKYIQDLKK
jgi:hypothetical protein